MVFNSLEFLLFLPIVYLIYLTLYRKERSRDLFLLIASYFFYMSWYWQYAGLIAISTIIDYTIGKRLSIETDARRRKFYLIASLCSNLGILAFFKYFNFFSELSAESAKFIGFDINPTFHQLLLPVGISFYTFQTLSYTIDVYRKRINYEPNLIKFAVFVSFFPQLVAGPIVRASEFLPQINEIRKPTFTRLNIGMSLVFLGFFKKIVIADLLALLAIDAAFDNPLAYSSLDLMAALYAYSFQIYCDFSGYSDIAIGTALMLGFILPRNFDRPYISKSPSEFWQRWHISLSSWLRDYLYIPLGGNKGGNLKTLRNLFLTMLLGGLWHGAALNFILWGAFHGILLIGYKILASYFKLRLPAFISILIFYHLTLFGWLLFRVTNFDNYMDYTGQMFMLTGTSAWSLTFYVLLIVAALMQFLPRRYVRDNVLRVIQISPVPVQAVGYSFLLLLFASLSLQEPNFIYFQF